MVVGDVTYNLYRHPELYQNARVSAFIDEMWYRENTGTPKPYTELTGWEKTAATIYRKAYQAAKAQKENSSGK